MLLNRKHLLFFCTLGIGLLIATSCVPGSTQEDQTGELAETERPTPPGEFESLNNPLRGERQAFQKGQAIYEANCSSCHGLTGKGDGPVAAALEPKPVDLATAQSELSDGYLYWRISEGGMTEQFGSMMPAWRGLLREEQIWLVITFLRTLGG